MDASSQKENGSQKAINTNISQVNLVRPKSSGVRHWSVFEKVLVALALIFFVGFVVFVALYVAKLSDDGKNDKISTGKLVLL